MGICFRLFIAAAALALLGSGSAFAQNITAVDWGTAKTGEKVSLYTLKGAHGLQAPITNYGGRIVSLDVPNRQGGMTDVHLGYDDFAAYEKAGAFYGALVGRYVGRISHGGSFPLNGKTVQLQKSDPNAPGVRHSGTAGVNRKVWKGEMHDGAEPSLTLTLVSPDGDGDFPGQLSTTVTYTVTGGNALKLEYRAVPDRPTVANFTNHAMFTLQGEGNGDISNQTMQVFADRFTPADAGNLVTGEVLPVEGTPADFRKGVRVGDVENSDFPQIAMRKGIELEMVINGPPGTLRPAARISDPHTGIVMDVSTTHPCVVVWAHLIGDRVVSGKGGKPYRNFDAMSFETQGYLDAVNHPNFPSTVITPDKPLHEVTVFKFSVK